MKPRVISVSVGEGRVHLVSGSTGFVTESGRLKTFVTADDAVKFCGGEATVWPEQGRPVNLEFAKQWIRNPSRPTTLEALQKLSEVDSVYVEINLAYSDYKPENIPAELLKEFTRCHEATFSGKRNALAKLANLVVQQDVIAVSNRQGWNTEKLIQGWGGRLTNEWTADEIDQLKNELAIELEFIENVLRNNLV